MEQPVKEWFTRISKGAAKQLKLQEQQERRDALLLNLHQERLKNAQTIEQGVDQVVVKDLGGGKGVGQNTRRLDNDQMREFDLDEQNDGYRLGKSVDGTYEFDEYDEKTGRQEGFEKLQKAGRLIDGMALQMETAMVDDLDEDGKVILEEVEIEVEGKKVKKSVPKQRRMFSNEEIANELYDPLRRSGLMPETMIPDKYSRTQEMLEGSFEAYAKRLKEDEKGVVGQLFAENFGMAKTMVGSMMTLGGTGQDLSVSMGKEAKDLISSSDVGSNIKSIQDELGKGGVAASNQLTKFVGQGYGLLFGVADEGVEDLAGAVQEGGQKKIDEAKARRRVAALLAQGLVTTGAMSLGVAINADATLKKEGLAMAASSTFGALLPASKLAALLNKEALGPKDVQLVASAIGEALSQTLKSLDWAKQPDPKGVLQLAATAMAGAMATKPDGAGVVEKVVAGEVENARLLFAAAINEAVKAGITDELVKAFTVDVKNVRVAKANASEVLDRSFGKEDTVPDDVRAGHKVLGHEAKWEHGSKGWTCTICEKQDVTNPEILAGVLDRKIAQLKRDQALLNWGSTLVGMGIDVATNFIAPLAIAGCALKVAKNLWEAGNRTRDMLAFIEDRKGMLMAASAFSSPVAQFIDNSNMQSQHYFANAAFEAVKMIGAIVQCTGAMAAPVGVGLQAGASAAQAIEQILYELDKRLKLEKAWTMYKRALERPQNRKIGLEAIAQNPTLAKYAVAWGAVIKQDVLVEDFMDACGLSPESLKDPKGGIDKVVSYLELRMSDDNVVTGRKIRVDDALLKASVWLREKAKVEKEDQAEVQDTREVEAALLAVELALREGRKAAEGKALTQTQRKGLIDKCEACELALFQYKAVRRVDAGGGFCSEVDLLKQSYTRALKRVSTEANGWAVA